MGKERTTALERAKKATATAKGRASSQGGSSSRSKLPQGWVQGDWIRSTITEKDLADLADEGLIPHGSARLPGRESQPQPKEGECVLLATHYPRQSDWHGSLGSFPPTGNSATAIPGASDVDVLWYRRHHSD